jgi:KDO2-lipid IV(A) lauroyltransferase
MGGGDREPRRLPGTALPLRLLGPQHWHTWIGLAILNLLSRLPYPLLVKAGHAVGRLARHLPLHYVQIARSNLALCLPELAQAEREKILAAHFKSLGMTLCEAAMNWWSPDSKIAKLSSIEGLEHLSAAHARGNGVILLTCHFTTLEISARILGGAVPLTVLYRTPKNPVLAHVADRHRSRLAVGRTIPPDDIRAMVRALKDNQCVWYAPDQSYRKKGAEMVRFFGVPAATNVATSRLAKMTGAAVLFFSHERLPNGAGYRVVIHPPLDNFPSDCAVADAQRFHAFIEAEVRRNPEQYWWIHRRFKGLSADYPNYYGKAARRGARAPRATQLR